jgi:hypothetical protein
MWFKFFEDRGLKASCVNNGDDTVIIMEKADYATITLADLQEHFTTFGFTLTLNGVVDVFERIEFCRMQPVFDGEKWRMVRAPKLSLDKDLCSVRSKNLNDYLVWRYNVGECGLALTSGIPILQEYYEWLMRTGHKGVLSSGAVCEIMTLGMYNLRRNLVAERRPVSEEARVSFYKAFGPAFLPDMQLALEKMFAEEVGLSVNHLIMLPGGL